MSHKLKLPLWTLVVSSFLSSCSGLIVSPVSDANRDTKNTYDGRWSLNTRPLNSIQDIGIDRFRCKFVAQTISMTVSNGIGRIYFRGTKHAGNIAGDGKFRIEIPTDRRFTKSDGNNDVKNRITYIYQGFLSADGAPGLFILGKENLNNTGCSTKLDFTKV